MRTRILGLFALAVVLVSVAPVTAFASELENVVVSVHLPRITVVETVPSPSDVKISFFQSGAESIVVRSSDGGEELAVSHSTKNGWNTVQDVASHEARAVTYDIWQF